MEVALLNPPTKDISLYVDPILTRCVGVPSKAPYLWPPIGLAYIAGVLQSEFSVSIIDAQAERLDYGSVVKRLYGCDVVFVNIGTPTLDDNLELCSLVKKKCKGIKIVLIGNHAACYPKELLKFKYVDFVIRNEPEYVALELCRALKNKKGLSKVNGVSYRKNNKIFDNKKASLITDLDSMPFPARNLLPVDRYYDILTKGRSFTLTLTSRGCPYRCTFCSAHTHSGGRYRMRSAQNVYEECVELKDSGYDEVFFFDDTFTINRKRVLEICRLIAPLKLSWRCLSRVDTVDYDMLKVMERAGCYQIHFGVESGSQKILELMNKRATVGQSVNAFKWCHKLGIETVGYFMVGYPGETLSTINETLRLINKIKPSFITIPIFNPIPGSDIFDRIKGKYTWDQINFTDTSFCDIPSHELLAIVEKAYKKYYFTIKYPVHRVMRMKRIGDFTRFIKQNFNFWRKREGVLWKAVKK